MHTYVWKLSQGLQPSPILIQLGHWEANLLKFPMALILRLAQADINDRCDRFASDYSIKGMCYLALQHLRRLPTQERHLKPETKAIARRLLGVGQGASHFLGQLWTQVSWASWTLSLSKVLLWDPPPPVPVTPLSWINPVSCFVS